MAKRTDQVTRDERHRELLEMWRARRGQAHVLSLFHRALPEDQTPCAGMSVFEVILNHEFGNHRHSESHEQQG